MIKVASMLKLMFSKLVALAFHWQFAFWLLVIIVCGILEFTNMRAILSYDRGLIEAGQWYRLITANFVHLNPPHLYLNMTSVMLIMFFFPKHLTLLQWMLLMLISCLAVSVGLYILNPEVKSYVGLSGVLHGLFIAGVLKEIKHFPVSGWLLLGIFVVKLFWEQFVGAMPGSGSLIKGHVLVDSHLYGAVAGGVFIFLLFIFNSKKP